MDDYCSDTFITAGDIVKCYNFHRDTGFMLVTDSSPRGNVSLFINTKTSSLVYLTFYE